MTDADYPQFREMFEALSAAFRVRFISDKARDQSLAQYYDVLRLYAIGDVRRGFERLRDGENFPKGPAQWRQAIPRSALSEVPAMAPGDFAELEDAESRGYEGNVCHCQDCRAAEVTHQPIRYVPREDSQGRLLKARHPRTGEEKILGVWIHGERLRNWYTARANFYEAFATLKRRAMPKAEVSDPNDVRKTVEV